MLYSLSKLTRLFLYPIGWLLIATMSSLSCATHKEILSAKDLSGDQIVILGLVEFDYSLLENKIIQGIDVYLESEEKYSDIKLPGKYLPNESYKEFQFLCKTGNYGVYDLNFKKNVNYTPDTDNLLTVMDMERNISSTQTNTLFQYNLYEGKVINLGKLIIMYKGGTIESGTINYSYDFTMVEKDTTALFAFRQTYPGIYENCRNEIYLFRNEFESCIDYVLSNISEGKRLRIEKFMEGQPDKVEQVFYNLTNQTQQEYAKTIESYSFEQLEDFLQGIK